MLIIGCDYHPSVQQVAFVDTETGECQERRLAQERGITPQIPVKESPFANNGLYGVERFLPSAAVAGDSSTP